MGGRAAINAAEPLYSQQATCHGKPKQPGRSAGFITEVPFQNGQKKDSGISPLIKGCLGRVFNTDPH